MPPRSKQHRLTIRVPDVIMASLRRQLDVTRRVVGERYSLNDLCVKKLSTGEVAAKLEQESVASRTQSGTFVIPRVPPPPPVPIVERPTLAGPMMPWQRSREEPQPERQVRANPEPEPTLVPESIIVESGVDSPDVEPELARMADEGGPDGHLDD